MTERPDGDENVFAIDTRFQKMARRPGGVSRERALENAQRQVEDLKPGFADWLDRELPKIAASIREVANNSGDVLLIDRAYLGCRQLRDVGTTMGFELVTFIANNLCDILDAVRTGASCDKSVIECHIDALFLARTEPYRNLSPDQLPEMTKGLRRVVELANSSAQTHETK